MSNPPVLDHGLGRKRTYDPTELAQAKQMERNTCFLSFGDSNATAFIDCAPDLSTVKSELHMVSS
jgi:hypothetical protein